MNHANNQLKSDHPDSAIPYSDSLWKKAYRKFIRDRAGLIGLAIVIAYAFIAIGAGLGFWASDWEKLLAEGIENPSAKHWFGTNWNGQDIFQRTIYSTKTAFEVGLIVAVFSVLLGAIAGCMSGYYNGTFIDELVLWFMSCIDCIPFYLFVAALALAIKDNPYGMHIALIATLWTSTARYIRGEVIKLKNFEFIEAAKAIGVPNYMIIAKHIFPNTLHILLVQSTINFVTAIKQEVILSYLGLGIKENISWGLMLSESPQEVNAGYFNNFLAASVLMFILVMAFNIFSDSLQDALDPKKIT